MPAELSALALEGSGVGLLTGTKSIVGGIAIATMPILAHYLQENAARWSSGFGFGRLVKKQGIQADMASSIVVASGKGGVGKTSLAVNLG